MVMLHRELVFVFSIFNWSLSIPEAYGSSWMTLKDGRFLSTVKIGKTSSDSVMVCFNPASRLWIHIDSIQYLGRTEGSKLANGILGGLGGGLLGMFIGAKTSSETGGGHPNLGPIGTALTGAAIGIVGGAIIGVLITCENSSVFDTLNS